MNTKKRAMLNEMIERLTFVKKTLVKEVTGGYLGKKVYEVELKNGNKIMVEQLTKNKGDGDAVVIIPVTLDNQYVMIGEARPNLESYVAISFPAGMVDKGEDYEITAKRELLEETGYTSETIEQLEWHYQDQGCSSAKIITFLARDCKKKNGPQLDGFEQIESIELADDDIIELISDGKINDANSLLAWYTYDLKRKKERK